MMQVHHPDGMAGEVRVCEARDLDTLTMQGWKLVFSYQDTEHIACSETEPMPPNAQNAGYYNNNGTIPVVRYRPNTTTRFVLHKGENAVIEELNSKLRELEGSLANERTTHAQTTKAFDDANKKFDTLKKTSDFDAATHKNVVEERNRFRTSATKLEGDLAKIRKAIGERAFGEILPPEDPKPATAQSVRPV